MAQLGAYNAFSHCSFAKVPYQFSTSFFLGSSLQKRVDFGILSYAVSCSCHSSCVVRSHRSTKITIERPRGLKANLQRLLQQRTDEDMHRVAGGDERYRRLFFSLCWMHSILVERGKFHNVGWSTPASFSDSDFFVGDSLLATYCEQVSN